MSAEGLILVGILVIVLTHGFTLMVRPRQIEAAVRAALEPMARDMDAIRSRLDEHEERMLRTEASHRALDTDLARRLSELLVHVTRIESGMQTRTDYERLHHRINELGRQVAESTKSIAGEISAAETKAEQAVARVTRIEAHLMEKDR